MFFKHLKRFDIFEFNFLKTIEIIALIVWILKCE